ncbi:MAG: DUF115 domain-containing protein [Treponema sp.]|nr:DUF115 domain-containing protein [Treponema sp.]
MIDETPRRVAARRGFSVAYKGKTLLSTGDPVALAESAVAAATKLRGPTLYFCPSPLYGYGLPLLLESMGEDSAVLCVEADEKLLDLSAETIDGSVLANPRFLLTGAGDGAALAALVRQTWGSRRFRRVEELRLSGGRQLSPALYDALADALRREIALDWGNAMTLVKLGRRYARNALGNLALLPRSPPLSALDFGAAPVLVLGAGPSLDGFLDGLAARFGDLGGGAGSFKIVCVDTALSCLYQRRIKPDLAVALESQHWNLRDFIGLGGWEIPLAMDLSALGATGEMLGGRPLVFFTPWTCLTLFNRLKSADLLPEEFPPLGSVGLSAAAIACRVSTGPVIVAGMDFAFSLDRTHARSAPAHLERLRGQTRFRSLIDPEGAFRKGCHGALAKTGEPVRSNRTLKNYRDLFQREFAGQPGRVRDAAGPGLDLGLETLTVEAACEVLAGGADSKTAGGSRSKGAAATAAPGDAAKLRGFVEAEIAGLRRLRGVLSGESAEGAEQLGALLDRCGYLWAHFPDCAGAGGRRPAETDLGFLKRARAEIDPFIALLETVLLRLD